MTFQDRKEAGKALARRLGHYRGRNDVLVLGVPRGGAVLAAEVAEALEAPLDVFLCRKLGVPGEAQLAFGAVAPGGVRVLDEEIISALEISPEEIERVTREEQQELDRRERAYRAGRPFPKLIGRVAILVDDGIATGASMLAAVRALRAFSPARMVVSVPVSSSPARERLSKEVDEFVCLAAPAAFYVVAQFYKAFPQVSDEEVVALLDRYARPAAQPAA